jgi:hypothetical protein
MERGGSEPRKKFILLACNKWLLCELLFRVTTVGWLLNLAAKFGTLHGEFSYSVQYNKRSTM